MEEREYEVIIATPAKNRYHESILPYLHSNFSFERAVEIDENIIQMASFLTETLSEAGKRIILKI